MPSQVDSIFDDKVQGTQTEFWDPYVRDEVRGSILQQGALNGTFPKDPRRPLWQDQRAFGAAAPRFGNNLLTVDEHVLLRDVRFNKAGVNVTAKKWPLIPSKAKQT